MLARLIKCLERTASDHDGEALSSIRAANRELLALNLHWPDVIRGPADLVRETKVKLNLDALNKRRWGAMLSVFSVLNRSPFLTPDERTLVGRIADTWAHRGAVSTPDFKVLVRLLRRSQRIDLLKKAMR